MDFEVWLLFSLFRNLIFFYLIIKMIGNILVIVEIFLCLRLKLMEYKF